MGWCVLCEMRRDVPEISTHFFDIELVSMVFDEDGVLEFLFVLPVSCSEGGC